MPKLTIYLPNEEPLRMGFEDQIEVNIGRASDNDIVITHESMSGHHAQLKLTGDQYVLIDLDSTNGTFLDGAPISQAALHNGARITFGRVEADYECEDAGETGEAEVEDDAFSSSGGSGYETSIHAAIAAQSLRPANFRNMSPVEKVEKKDGFSKVAMLLGIVGLLASLAMAGFAYMMKI
jgi:pSer/pThr/pTyr-binding forkhead associated (FHA) protein